MADFKCWHVDGGEEPPEPNVRSVYDAESAAEKFAERCYYDDDCPPMQEVFVREAAGGTARRFSVEAEPSVSFSAAETTPGTSEEAACEECEYGHGYGYYPGGDPRHFSPDPECCTDKEIAAHKSACEAWERGEMPDPGGPHLPITEENIAKYAPSVVVKHGAGGHITVAHYGIGTYTLPCSIHGVPR